jgi:MSHA pilin protein MshC
LNLKWSHSAPFLFGLHVKLFRLPIDKLGKAGFTVVELVVVIVTLGILAAFALPRFIDIDSFRVRATYDEVAGALRYAQKLAVVSGCDVEVTTTANSYSVRQRSGGIPPGGDCPTGAYSHIQGHPIESPMSTDISLSNATIIFDAMGRRTGTAAVTVGGSETISIVAETGYVDAP